MKEWTYEKDPVQPVYRILEGARIVGLVAVEAEAKQIVELHNAAREGKPPSVPASG
jgi:hypothetical protein